MINQKLEHLKRVGLTQLLQLTQDVEKENKLREKYDVLANAIDIVFLALIERYGLQELEDNCPNNKKEADYRLSVKEQENMPPNWLNPIVKPMRSFEKTNFTGAIREIVKAFGTKEFTVADVECELAKEFSNLPKNPRSRIAMVLQGFISRAKVQCAFEGKGSTPYRYRAVITSKPLNIINGYKAPIVKSSPTAITYSYAGLLKTNYS